MAAPSLRSFSPYTPAVATASHVIAVPAGVVDGDVLIVYLLAPANPGNPTITLPAGWTQLWQLSTSPQPTNSYTIVCATRTASSEPASYTFGTNVSDRPVGFMLAVKDTGGVGQSDKNIATATTTSYASPSITTTIPGDLILILNGAYAAGIVTESFTPPGTYTEFADVENTNNHAAVEVSSLLQGLAGAASGTSTATVASAPTTGIISLIPSTGLKTIEGVARASIKTINGVQMGFAKTVEGLA